jgi:hypothetical protein
MIVSSAMLLAELVSNRTQNPTWAMILASGNRPTPTQLRSLIYGGYGFYVSDGTFSNLVTAVGGKQVIRFVSLNPVTTELTPQKLTFKLSEVVAKGSSLQNDPPTWGILYFDMRSTGAADFQGWRAVYFTVGDENSNADMKIQGGFIPKDSEWKPNDITINFAGLA